VVLITKYSLALGPHVEGQSLTARPSHTGQFFFGHTFNLFTQNSTNYACVVKYDTPLTHILAYVPNQTPPQPQISKFSTGSAIPTCSLGKQGT